MLDQQLARFEIGSEELVKPTTIVTDVSDSFGFGSRRRSWAFYSGINRLFPGHPGCILADPCSRRRPPSFGRFRSRGALPVTVNRYLSGLDRCYLRFESSSHGRFGDLGWRKI